MLLPRPKWLVEDFDGDNSFGDLAEQANSQSDVVVKENIFDDEKLDFFSENDIVLCQTSIGLALRIQKETNWKPGPWLTAENYECVKYYPILKSKGIPLLNGRGEFFRKNIVECHIENLVEQFGEKKTKRIFIRPSSGLKPFTGMVFIGEDPHWHQDWYWVNVGCKSDDILLVGPPLEHYNRIVKEWRFIAAEGEIISGSQYMSESGEAFLAEYPEEAYELAKATAPLYKPDPMYTVDICKSADGKFHVMELNSFSCAGLYKCDLTKVIGTAIEIARRQYGSNT